jgi:hypothetical protein
LAARSHPLGSSSLARAPSGESVVKVARDRDAYSMGVMGQIRRPPGPPLQYSTFALCMGFSTFIHLYNVFEHSEFVLLLPVPTIMITLFVSSLIGLNGSIRLWHCIISWAFIALLYLARCTDIVVGSSSQWEVFVSQYAVYARCCALVPLDGTGQ